MALKQFLRSSIKWVPQPGFSVVYTENGGIEASQDILIRNADISTVTVFNRGVRWETIFPEVPAIYQNLKMKTSNPIDRGDGFSIIKCIFTGYQFASSGSSGGAEEEQATSTLTGQLTAEPLSTHPKWVALVDTDKAFLGMQINGDISMNADMTLWGTYQEDMVSRVFVPVIDNDGNSYPPIDDALIFAQMIAQGEQTWDRGGWTYSYHTESEEGFTPAQLNLLGKIVATPPGKPEKPNVNWTWMLASPSQSQSGLDRFIKTLDFRLIQNTDKNIFLYEA
jgi:hypothetical protein